MDSNLHYPDYNSSEPSKKKKNFFFVYLFIFGLLLGVFLANTFGPHRKTTPEENQIMPSDEIQSSRGIPATVFTDYEKAVISATEKAKSLIIEGFLDLKIPSLPEYLQRQINTIVKETKDFETM